MPETLEVFLNTPKTKNSTCDFLGANKQQQTIGRQ